VPWFEDEGVQNLHLKTGSTPMSEASISPLRARMIEMKPGIGRAHPFGRAQGPARRNRALALLPPVLYARFN
jgi:hypothetical protein